LYDEIADAMRELRRKGGVSTCAGAQRGTRTLTDWNGTAEDLMNEYIDLRRSQGKRPFLDCPHFEFVG
jgi:hypothetical protein